jgi:hypothetical protein
MTDAKPSSITGRHKVLMAGGVILALTGASALVLLRPGTACQGVFEQTAPRLEANIELIKNKGGFAVSQEKVQELTDGAQKVGLHLKTCCSVLEGGKLNPDQFQQCVERASTYEKQIAEVAQQVDTAATAQQQGNTAIVQQQTRQIAQTLQSAASEVVAFEQQITQLAPAAVSAPGVRGGTEREPNDTKDSAAELRIDTRINGEIARTDDSDHFKFTSGKPVRDRVIAKLENRSETLRPSITLFGPDKAQLQEAYNGTPGADTELAFTAEPGKQYFLRVNPYGTTGTYTLSVAAQNAHDRFEPNDDPARHAPTPIAAGKSIDASILDAQDDDWYVLKAAPGSRLRLRLENRSTTLRPSVIVYNAQRSQLHNPYDGTPGASLDFSFEVTPGASYYFRAQPYGTYGTYRITVN